MPYDPVNDHDPHRYNSDVHYRLYLDHKGKPAVICVQDFDYPDYDPARFLSPDAWNNEADAELALSALLRAVEMIASTMTVTVQLPYSR